MGIIFGWLFLSFIVALIGRDRNIGFGGGCLLSLLLSPILGLIFTLVSKKKVDIEKDKATARAIEVNQEALKILNKSTNTPISISEEISKLAELKDSGKISEVEYQALKDKLLN